MGTIIKCCRYCVAPKRHPGCHGTCPEYIAERVAYDQLKAIDDERIRVRHGCYQQRDAAVRKAMKGRGK